ncbi:MAG: hypothetical protein ABEJ68_09440 [Halobacteriaceae archaeon]
MRPTLSHVRLVAETELRRRWRATRDNTVQLAAIGLLSLFYLAVTAAGAFGGYVGGQALAAGDVATPLRYGRYAAAAALLFPTFIIAFRTAARLGTFDALDGLLTTVPHDDVAGGLLAAESVWFAGTFGLPALLAVIAFGVGAGSPALAATVLLALVATAGLGVVTGFTLGFAARNVLARSEFVARHRTALGALVFVGYMALVGTGRVDTVVQPLLEFVRATPVGWFADLALLPAGVAARPLLAGAAVVGTPVLGASLFGASAWLAGRYWYGDHARGPTGETHSRRFVGGLSSGVFDGLPRPTAAVARKSWLRAIRAPIKLVYVAYPLFFLVGYLSQALEAGAIPAELPPLLALYGAWATGAAFTLNPLGDEGAVMPVAVTTPVTGRQFVTGLLVSGVAVGTPLSVLVALGTAALSPLDVAAAGVTVGVALVFPTIAAAIAAGAGSLFPKFEASNITRSREAIVPSIYAFGLYSLVLVVTWLPAGVGGMAAEPLGEAAGVSPAVVAIAGGALTLLVGAVVALVSVRYAARRFATFRL